MRRAPRDQDHTPKRLQQMLALIRAIAAIDKDDLKQAKRNYPKNSSAGASSSLPLPTMTTMHANLSSEQAAERHSRVMRRWVREGGPQDEAEQIRLLEWGLESGLLEHHHTGEGVMINPNELVDALKAIAAIEAQEQEAGARERRD